MPAAALMPQPRRVVWACRLAAAVLILGAAALRIWFLAVNCPFELSSDEAHYWEWSQHLDWSYYSKGPLVALIIRLGCWLAGDWSMQLTGSEMLAVRLPAVVCGSLMLLGLYVLTVRVYRRDTLALGLVAAALTVPIVAAGSLLMTIDSPFTCLWCWALVLGHAAIFGRARWAWPALGLVLGLGILAKYTMILWFGSLGFFLLTSPEHRRLLLRPGLWVCVLVAGLCCLPILYWNMLHHWVGVLHVGGIAAGGRTETQVEWYGPLAYVGIQAGVLMVFWFIAWARAMWASRPWFEPDAQRRYLWWMSAVTFALFFGFSFTTHGGEPNWPITAYLSGAVLAAGWLAREYQAATGWYRSLVQFSVVAGCVVGLGMTVLIHQAPRLTPLLAQLVPPPSVDNAAPIRRLDPTCRLRSWQFLAQRVDQEVEQLRRAGIEPIVVGGNWWIPGELAFYCKHKFEHYSIGLGLGCRHSQHDFWRPNPVFDPEQFRGRTFLFVSDLEPMLNSEIFDQIERDQTFDCIEDDVPIMRWHLSICRGFKRFPIDLKQNRLY